MNDTINTTPPPIPLQNNDDDLSTEWIRWKCLNCQFLYEGPNQNQALICPRCGNQHPDKFADID